MSKNKIDWSSIRFPIVRNIQPTTLSNQIEGIPTSEMPKRMAEMFADVQINAIKTIEDKLEELREVKGHEDRVEYLEGLLKTWTGHK